MPKGMSLFGEKICKVFNAEFIEQAAKDTAFVMRKSKITASIFLETVLNGVSEQKPASLLRYISSLNSDRQLSISPQGFDKRFNVRTVSFFNKIFSYLMQDQSCALLNKEILTSFNRVLIQDSTKFKIHESHKENFGGFGKDVPSALCIQLQFDVKASKMESIDIAAGNSSDSKSGNQKAHELQPDDLVINDLGYFSIATFRTIEQKKAYFVSRLKSQCNVYNQEDGAKLDFKKLYLSMEKRKEQSKKIAVFIGADDKFPVLLHLQIVPDEVYAYRLLKKDPKRRGRKNTMTDDVKIRNRFSCYITNAEHVEFTIESIINLYKVRWQIELFFKIWKSTYSIDKINKTKESRMLCQIYAKLILILINQQIFSITNEALFSKGKRLLSLQKCHNTLYRGIKELVTNLFHPSARLNRLLNKIWLTISENHFLHQKKNKVGLLEILASKY